VPETNIACQFATDQLTELYKTTTGNLRFFEAIAYLARTPVGYYMPLALV
jgi:hypothetical protein